MNKKIKLLTPILCGALLSSSLALTSVQAADVKNGATNKVASTQNYGETYTDFNYYATISEYNLKRILNYFNASRSNQTESAVHDFLVDNNITSNSVANIISYEFRDYLSHGIAEAQDYGNGITFLKVPNINLIRITIVPNDQYNYDYRLYTKILSLDAYKVSDYISDNPNLTTSQLTNYLINNNIVSSTYASKVAPLLLGARNGKYTTQGRINYLNWNGNPGCGILVLQSKTNPNVLVLAPQEY